NNRACSYVHYNELVELRNSCGNCLDAQRLTTKLRFKLVPKGTELKVVETYSIGQNKGLQSKHMFHIVTFMDGLSAEMRAFLLPEKNKHVNHSQAFEEKVLADVKEL